MESEEHLMKFVVIGGDAAGMSAASRAKRNMPDLEVTVLEKSHDVSYSACGMPYNIADPEIPIEKLVVREAEVFRKKQKINLLTGHCVNKIDRKTKQVKGVTDDGLLFSFSFDKLLIATGAHPKVPRIPGFDMPGVLALNSLDDGRRMKNYIRKEHVRRVMILGMGYIAMEMCEALRKLDIEVDMIKPRETFIPWLDKEMGQVVRDELESHGVNLYPGYRARRIEPSVEGIRVVSDDVILEGDMVLVAAGVVPNSELAADAGLDLSVNNAIAVDAMMRTSDKDIYAAGDCADAFHVLTGKRVWIPLALRANRAGWAAADNVCGKNVYLDGVAGTAVLKVFNLEVARTGLTFHEALEEGFEPVSVTIKSRSRAHAHPGSKPIWVHMIGDKTSGKLLGTFMIGREGCAHRINAAVVALHSQMSVETFSLTDLAYAPPFGPVWDPLLTAANRLVKKLCRL